MNTDPYKQRAAEMFNVSVADVTPEQRRIAKRQCYVEAYGVHVSGGKAPEIFRVGMGGTNTQQIAKKEKPDG